MISGSRLFLVLLMATTLTACAGGGGPGPDGLETFSVRYRADLEGKVHTFGFSVDQVATTLPAVYEHLGLPVGRSSGSGDLIFITPSLTVTGDLYEGERNSEYLDCGQGISAPLADTYELEFVIVTRVRANGASGTLVDSYLDGSAKARFFNDNPVGCIGTGKLEGQIADVLDVFLKQPD